MEFLWVCLNSVHREASKNAFCRSRERRLPAGSPLPSAQLAPLSLFREGVVERLNGFRKVLLRDADDDVDFARALRDHADIDVGFGQGAEELRGRSHAGIHIAADNGNQCELHLVVEKKQLDKQQMEEYLYSRLPYYMIPKHMHCLEQFPLNTSSKTDRKKIQELI